MACLRLPPFRSTRFLWIFMWHCGGVCACGIFCAACVWSHAYEQAARDKERGGARQGKGDGDIAVLWNWREAASPACQREFSPRQVLLFAGMCIRFWPRTVLFAAHFSRTVFLFCGVSGVAGCI